MDHITVKTTKLKGRSDEGAKKTEPFNCGEHSYSQIKIEYQQDSDLAEFVEDKSIKTEVSKDMYKGEGGALAIYGGGWNADLAVWQRVKDAASKVGDISQKSVEKVGEKIEAEGSKLKEAAGDESKKRPKWALPAGLIFLVAPITGIIILISYKSKK